MPVRIVVPQRDPPIEKLEDREVAWTEQVARVAGRPYRAKRRPSIQTFDDGWDYGGVIVLRTHDVDVAVAIPCVSFTAG